MKKGLKLLRNLLICVVIGSIICVSVLKFADSYIKKILQASYIDIQTYRTTETSEIKQEDIITVPENAEQLQFAYNNKYYAYLEDGIVHIYNTDTKDEFTTIEEDDNICYFYMMYDKNLILYFEEYTNGSYSTLTLRSFDISTKKKTEYNDINVSNFSRVKDITMSPLINIIYVNIETKSSWNTNNVVYTIDLFNSMSQVKSGIILDKIMMLQFTNDFYYQDEKGGVYTGGYSLNRQFGYSDAKIIGADEDDNLYLLDTKTYDKVYVFNDDDLVNTIPLSDTDIVTTYNEFDGVYLVYPTYILDITGKNPYKRIAKLSKYVTFEAIKGDTVYLRTSNNKIIRTKLLDN